MYGEVLTIHVGFETLVLGQLGTSAWKFSRPGAALNLLRSMSADSSGCHQLRSYLSRNGHSHDLTQMSDHDVVRVVGAEIELDRLQAIVLPATAFYRSHTTNSNEQAKSSFPPKVATQAVRWSRDRVVKEVIERAAAKVPANIRDVLLS